MSKSKKKTVKTKYNPPIEKAPRTSPQNLPESAYNKNPAWKLGLIDLDGPFSCKDIGNQECLLRIHAILKDYEKKTWSEIDDRKYNHPFPVYRMSKEAKTRLRELELNQYDDLYRLRISGLERIWGIREREYLSILWWDPKHKVCPVYKKHT